ncbi:MAG: undecaprenyldiphospho-muramoylpentapeptide beta-N-acetylglucosaminyltransferase [Gammaproteobacteria bacterium]|nr:undecaprenyldiphospho-muramoylpentapeptide beta-N-acetylglucosaminyltransferase [Gammaproteobacteria bacterium]MBU1654209.1 undecaprenyldiphospho-muramoylpentapeptide beta-N-acetylglucosaminyltransferase [Gammaproteobacteria bacterium]MBU1960869.1 undecaprenyldiphospho-muramoylpentapeptide beta-N-acetylglucosaminyltransferase [Gammaproteobacteria bacterium]
MGARVMIMAAGTGGHVFPGLAVAQELRKRGHEVFWLGTPHGMENRLVPPAGIEMEFIRMQGLRQNGLLRWLTAPFQLLRAAWQAATIIRRRRPDLALGMGGFVTGPGGLVARLSGVPLVIHEQNAVPGMANQWLAGIANRVLEAFPGSFAPGKGALALGNPVRVDISGLPGPEQRLAGREGPPRLLVIGGSLGAQVLNEQVPQALAKSGLAIEVRHQAGRGKLEQTQAHYRAAGVEGQLSEFIGDMAEAYAWADLVVCRAGALTVSELAAAGVAAILVPYPFAVDDHQTRNAGYLSDRGAAVLMPQQAMTPEGLGQALTTILSDRGRLLAMASAARGLGITNADAQVADVCEETMAHEPKKD